MEYDEALLKAVIELPDDDAPRLTYADQLDALGDTARAEFIRVQCSLAQMPPDDTRRPELQRREKELLEQYGWVWAAELGTQISEWVYGRGFIERVRMCLETSRDSILGVLQKAPIRHIRDVSQFCDLGGVVDALPYLEHLAGEEVAAAIDAIPFDRYQERLQSGLEEAIGASEHSGVTSIYLRIRTDIQWKGEYHLSEEPVREPFSPHEEYSHRYPLATFEAPSLPVAAHVLKEHSARGPLDPGGGKHYLLARTVAAFGRCIVRSKAPVTVFFSCVHAVFRMQNRSL